MIGDNGHNTYRGMSFNKQSKGWGGGGVCLGLDS